MLSSVPCTLNQGVMFRTGFDGSPTRNGHMVPEIPRMTEGWCSQVLTMAQTKGRRRWRQNRTLVLPTDRLNNSLYKGIVNLPWFVGFSVLTARWETWNLTICVILPPPKLFPSIITFNHFEPFQVPRSPWQ